MTYRRLRAFLVGRMSMSHIYQPVLIRTLLTNSGQATVRRIAAEFLRFDQAQLEYYTKVAKRWPKTTLMRHGIIRPGADDSFRLRLDVAKLRPEERRELIQLCNRQIQAYLSALKGIVGDHRFNPDGAPPSSLRFQVLALAEGRCALCGASVKDLAIDIDHIIPSSLGGKASLENLQALCFRCNRAKRNRDSRDFRNYGKAERVASCPFCSFPGAPAAECNTAVAIRDIFPVTPLHTLVIPKRHVETTDSLSAAEISDLFILAKHVKSELRRIDRKIAGFTVGFNDGAAAGQTVGHSHLHVIPRRAGDVRDPRGGIRGVIPSKRLYKRDSASKLRRKSA